MAIDTLRKREAAIRFGMPWMSGSRRPGSSFNKFERAALLGLYHTGNEPGTPACGFVFGYEPSTFEFPEESVVLSFSAEQTVLEFGDCDV